MDYIKNNWEWLHNPFWSWKDNAALQLEEGGPNFKLIISFSPEDFLALTLNTFYYRDYQFKFGLHLLCSEVHLNAIW